MTTLGLKQQLFEGINNIDENDFLLTLKELIDRKYIETSIPKLSHQQQVRIEESEEQIRNGEYYTDEEVNKLIEKWLAG